MYPSAQGVHQIAGTNSPGTKALSFARHAEPCLRALLFWILGTGHLTVFSEPHEKGPVAMAPVDNGRIENAWADSVDCHQVRIKFLANAAPPLDRGLSAYAVAARILANHAHTR